MATIVMMMRLRIRWVAYWRPGHGAPADLPCPGSPHSATGMSSLNRPGGTDTSGEIDGITIALQVASTVRVSLFAGHDEQVTPIGKQLCVTIGWDDRIIFGIEGLVGATGFEPATTCPPGRCATRLRHTPNVPRSLCDATRQRKHAASHGYQSGQRFRSSSSSLRISPSAFLRAWGVLAAWTCTGSSFAASGVCASSLRRCRAPEMVNPCS